MTRRSCAFLLLLFIAAGVRAEPAAEREWLQLLPTLGLSRADLSVRPDRWETRLTDPEVEQLLADPLAAPAALERWENALSSRKSLLAAAAAALPKSAAKAPPMPDVELSCDSLTPALDQPLSALVGQLEVIERQLKGALPGPAARARLSAALTPVLTGEPERALSGALFDEAGAFDAGRVASLAADADAAVRAVFPALRAALLDAPKRKIRCGDLLVGSRGDDEYSAIELEGASLVVDLGGANVYRGPAAAASAGQVRVVVDLGRDAVFESTGAVAGSGRFGVGLLYALGAGTTTIKGGDFSAGAGFFGAGFALLAGPARVETGSFGQGAGAFGAGALELNATAQARARFAAQGFGFTRGVGLFAARGRLDAACGLYLPDPREGLAYLSMCQGAGYGPRAYAGGGWGVARVEGPGSRLQASYFAQGAGYWRGAGLLSVHGDDTSLESRRYAQGTGVHSALGALRVRARRVSAVNWGVGPGYGWDYGVGVLDAEGDGLSFQNDWSGGRADANGRALVRIAGSKATLALHGLSYGSFSRGAPGWALVALTGGGHRLRAPGIGAPAETAVLGQTPYGLLSGWTTLTPDVSTAAVAWPAADRLWAAEREKGFLDERLARARSLPPEERTRELLFVVSRFGLAPQQVSSALEELAKTAAVEAPALAAALDPDRFDELLWIRLLGAALGRHAGWAALKGLEIEKAPLRRSLLLSMLRGAPLDVALEPALAELKSPDWRSRREAAGVLGSLLDASRGEEPGRLPLLEDTLVYLKDGDEAAFVKKAGVKRLSDLYAALALADRLPVSDRAALLSAAASPFDAVGEPALRKYLELAKASGSAVKAAFEAELAAARKAAPRARKALAALSADRDVDVAASGLVALGGLGSGSDASFLGGKLADRSALIRHAAAVGLSRLGPAGGSAVSAALESELPAARAGAAVAAARGWDGDLLVSTLRRALADPEPAVRFVALSAITQIQTPLLDRRKELSDGLKSASESALPQERAAAAARLAEIPK